MNIDETGHPENGKDLWTWGFHVPGQKGFTWFHIDPSRSTEVLYEFLGETFSGIIGCDYYSVYRKFLRETDAVMQFCWAHLIRDVKFLITLSDAVTRRYGQKLLAKIKILFRLWHRREQMPREKWERAARRAATGGVGSGPTMRPSRIEAQNIAQRFRDHGPYYFTFLKPCRASSRRTTHGTADAVRGHRPQDHAGHARRARPPLVRADVDGAGHVRAARSIGLRVPLPVDR